MIEKEININANGNNLSGTICLPSEEGRFPVVMMIHGSGPLDRDENMPVQKLNVFNAIAHSLAKQGIASLRYDKRGCGKSTGDYYSAGLFDVVDDAVSWFDFATTYEHFDVNKIFLLGHSEGCIIAPQVNIQRQNVAGHILLCPFVDKLDSILMKQAAQVEKEFEELTGFGGFIRKSLGRMMGANVESQKKLIDKLKSSDKDTIRVMLQKVPAKSLRELISLDPPAIFKQITRPMLIVGGEKDLQCDPTDVHKIAELVNAPVEKHVIKNLTHILRFDEGKPSMLETTKLLNKPIEPIVLDTIETWLKTKVL